MQYTLKTMPKRYVRRIQHNDFDVRMQETERDKIKDKAR